jgi:hypothetical protein
MGKYEPLKHFLAEQKATEVPMTFAEIERVVGKRLPPKAANHRAWWSNSPTNNVMTRAWLDAGYKTERVDMACRKLVFVRSSENRSPRAVSPSPPNQGVIARLRERLAGTVRIPASVDLTEPVVEFWDADR